MDNLLRPTLLWNTEPAGGNPPTNEIQASLQRLIERNSGGVDGVAQLLFRENHDYREQLRTLKAQLPPEGAVVLTGDQVQAWQAYTALGDHATLGTQVQELTQARQQLAALQQQITLNEASQLLGWKAAALQRLARADGVAIEIEERDGSRIPVVRESERKTIPLAEWAQQHWAEFLPALGTTTSTQTRQPSGAGSRFVEQPTTGKAPNNDPVADYIQRQAEAQKNMRNPLQKS